MSTDPNVATPVARVSTTGSVVGEIGYPNGHFGHLTPKEEDAFRRFKTLVKENGLLKPTHDDPLLLRYLRARRWVPEDALHQFRDTENWRASTDIETLYRTIDTESYEQSRRLYPQWTGRRDRRGIPLYVYEIRSLDNKTIAEYEKNGLSKTFSQAKSDGKTPPGLLRLFALYENLTRFNMPFCTQLKDREFPEVPITMSTNIVDISGVGLKQFWNLKAHMQSASELATAHYPETLDRIFIIGAPFFFSTVWGWIKRWFDPNTVSKIFVLAKHEIKPTLETFIDPRNIPKKYGGELDYEFGHLSVPDPAWEGVVQWEAGHNTFPGGPLLWEEVDDGKRLACFSLGSEKEKIRRERICTIPNDFQMPVMDVEPDNTAEGTQTEENEVYEARDDGVQTDDTLLSDEVNEKLNINDGVKKEGVEAAAPAPSTAAV